MSLRWMVLAVVALASRAASAQPPPDNGEPAPDSDDRPAVEAAPAPPAAEGAPAEPRTILVLDWRPIGATTADATRITGALAELLAQRASLRIVTVDDLEEMARHQEALQKLDCGDQACVAELSELANAEQALSGTIGRVGDQILINASLLDVANTRTLAGASLVAGSVAEAEAHLPELVADLFGESDATRTRYSLPEGEEVSFAVFDLQPLGIEPDVAQNLTQVLAAAIKKIEGTSVISRDDVAAIVQLQVSQLKTGCTDDTSCLAELGGALGVQKLVVGHVGELGDSYLVSLRLVDVSAVRVDSRVTESFSGQQEQLVRAVRHAGRNLLGVERTEPGILTLTGSEEEAVVYVDDREVGLLPIAPLEGLAPGRHSLRVTKDDFFAWRSDFYVESGATTPMWAELQEEPGKWYTKWWLWAGVGAVVAAGVGIYAYKAVQLPDTRGGAHEL